MEHGLRRRHRNRLRWSVRVVRWGACSLATRWFSRRRRVRQEPHARLRSTALAGKENQRICIIARGKDANGDVRLRQVAHANRAFRVGHHLMTPGPAEAYERGHRLSGLIVDDRELDAQRIECTVSRHILVSLIR